MNEGTLKEFSIGCVPPYIEGRQDATEKIIRTVFGCNAKRLHNFRIDQSFDLTWATDLRSMENLRHLELDFIRLKDGDLDDKCYSRTRLPPSLERLSFTVSRSIGRSRKQRSIEVEASLDYLCLMIDQLRIPPIKECRLPNLKRLEIQLGPGMPREYRSLAAKVNGKAEAAGIEVHIDLISLDSSDDASGYSDMADDSS